MTGSRAAVQALKSNDGTPPPPVPPSTTKLSEDDGEGENKQSTLKHAAQIMAMSLVGGTVVCILINAFEDAASWEEDTDTASVTVIVPALNEESRIATTVLYLRSLNPAPLEVIVVDGGSTDRTQEEAKRAGAQVISASRGRALQMNAGAKEAKGQLLCFVHADSEPPKTLVPKIRKTLSDGRTVLGGFRVLIRHKGRRLWWLTFHQLVKTFYAPALFRPLSFARGLRALFGDQTLFCRAADFRAVGGFDGRLRIMEDLDLVLRLHNAGPVGCPQIRQPGRRAGPELKAAGLGAGGGDFQALKPRQLAAVTMSDEEKLKQDLARQPRTGTPFEPDFQLSRAVGEVHAAAAHRDQAQLTRRTASAGTGHSSGGSQLEALRNSDPERQLADALAEADGKRQRMGWRAGAKCRGRIRMVINPPSVTSGRRLAAWGNLRATWIHLRLSTHWYFGGSAEGLDALYERLYTDAFR